MLGSISTTRSDIQTTHTEIPNIQQKQFESCMETIGYAKKKLV